MAGSNIYPKSDGNILYPADVNSPKLENNVNVIQSFIYSIANAPGTSGVYPSFIPQIDWFSSNSGKLSTLNTGSTIANYSTKDASFFGISSKNALGSNISEYSYNGDSGDGWVNLTTISGLNSGLWGVNFSAKTSAESSEPRIVCHYQAGGSYVSSGLGGTTSTSYVPYTFTNYFFNQTIGSVVIQMMANNGNPRTMYTSGAWVSGLTFETKTIQTNTKDILDGVVGYTLSCSKFVSGTGSIFYDLSLNGGSNWDTGRHINALYSTTLTGSLLTMRIGLSGTDANNYATIKGYGVALSY